MTVIVDTDALLGLFNPVDVHAEEAVKIAEGLAEANLEFLILPSTLAEFALLASSRVGVGRTRMALEEIEEMSYGIINIDTSLTKQAVELYSRQSSKEESLFDCLVVVAAKKHQTECVFSFDKGYRKSGLKLAGDWIK